VRRSTVEVRIRPAGAPACPQESIVTVVSFWLTIVLFVVVAFMLANNYYWRNQREEYKYRVEKFKAGRQGAANE